MAEEVFGKAGLNVVFTLMETLREIYRHIDPERVGGEIVVYSCVPPSAPRVSGDGSRHTDFAASANLQITDLWLEICADGLAYPREPAQNLGSLAEIAIVYRYSNCHEEFRAGPHQKEVPRYDPSARSQFAVPTLHNVREALLSYARENIRFSTCYLFKKVWHDENRLYFKAGPESIMRDSLTQFLNNRLGAEFNVWPEQNVNEKNPVDIRLQPRFHDNRLILIEIKWLGNSVSEDGAVTAEYRTYRAQEGADQLSEYLDEQMRSAPGNVIQAYYIMIDGRRRGLADPCVGTPTIDRANGLYYEMREIAFDPVRHNRPGFGEPYRMFAAPVCRD
jgi:hypothetical protein